MALVSYLGILDVGVGTAAVQRVARLMATDDRDGVSDLIRTLWVFFAGSAVVAVAITVGVAPFVASFLHLGTISPTLAGTTLIILGVMTGFTFLSVVPNAVLFGSGRNDRQTQIGLLSLVLMEVGQVVAVSLGAGLIAVAVLQLAGAAVILVLSVTLVNRTTGNSMRRGRFSRLRLPERGLRSLLAARVAKL